MRSLSNIIKAARFQAGQQMAMPVNIEKFVIDSNPRANLFFSGLQKSLEAGREEGVELEGLPIEEVSLIPLEVEQAIKEQAAVILEEPREEERRIKEQALKEAKIQKNSILEAAKEEGFKRGLEDAMAHIRTLEQDLLQQKERCKQEYEQQIDALEPLFSDLVIRYVEKLTGHLMEGTRPVVGYLMKEAVRNTESAKMYILHVPKESLEEAQAQEEELRAMVSNRASLEILSDSSLDAGECRLETENCVIASGIGTGLEILKENLRLLGEK